MGFRVITVLLMAAFLGACAEVPRSSTFQYDFQPHIQSASHHHIIARDMVLDIKASLFPEPTIVYPRIYVQDRDKSPFGRSFRTFLIDELHRNGFIVGLSEAEPMHLSWSTQFVDRSAERLKPCLPGVPFMVLAGVGTLLFGPGWTTTDCTAPHTELILTSLVTRDGTTLMRKSNTYYINDQDRNNYWPMPETAHGQKPMAQTTFRLVDR